jgi:hypothetical protein
VVVLLAGEIHKVASDEGSDMFRRTSGALPLLLVLAMAGLAPAAAQDWGELRTQGDLAFSEGRFAEAADLYNRSALLALDEGRKGTAAEILASLGRCFSEERLNQRDLHVMYLEEASDLTAQLAQDEEGLTEKADILLDSASLAREAGMAESFAEKVNASAFYLLMAAQGDVDLEAALDHVRMAGLLLEFNNLAQHTDVAVSSYLNLVLEEADRLTSEAESGARAGDWDRAGRYYFDAAILLDGLADPSAPTVFGLASDAFLRAAQGTAAAAEPEDLSHRGTLLRLAGVTAELNRTDGAQIFTSAGHAFSQGRGCTVNLGNSSPRQPGRPRSWPHRGGIAGISLNWRRPRHMTWRGSTRRQGTPT